ncbi:hypothetical protein [Mycoplasmopsis glycophila]|uniref:Uncharacterized protein n=2 Tax=Mycoplasmopsis glycophila TaxID=171285 RepID=A0A449AVP1_9BACT|nr:hypothetical protein [Mycoplasmopsis glycophila]VEU70678.1 Uncharacterised protein [Mycoplasmopsis glycophila]
MNKAIKRDSLDVIAMFHSIGKNEKITIKKHGLETKVGYHWFRSGQAIDYIARADAVLVQPNNFNQDKLNHIFLKSGKEEIEFMNTFLKKYSKDEKLTGIYEFTKDANDVSIEEAKRTLQSLDDKQRIYSMVFSPKSSLVIENRLFSKKEWVRILQKEIKTLCAKNGLDQNKIKGYMGIHVNTKTPHAHLIFFETEPAFSKKNSKEKMWFDRNYFPYKTIFEFKENTQREIDHKLYKEYQTMLVKSKGSLYDFKRNFKQNINKLNLNLEHLKLQSEIEKVALHCYSNKIKTFNRITDDDVKKSIVKIHNAIKKDHSSYRDFDWRYEQFLNSISNIQAYDKRALKELGDIFEKETKDKQTKLYNFVIQTCLNLDRKYKMEKSPYQRYLSNFYTENRIDWTKELDLPKLKDLNSFLQYKKVEIVEKLEISFKSEIDDFVQHNQIDLEDLKSFKVSWAKLKNKIKTEKCSLNQIVKTNEMNEILSYLSKYNTEFQIFETKYDEMLNAFNEKISKLTDYKAKSNGYQIQSEFVEDIQKAKALVVLSKMNSKGGKYSSTNEYNMNFLWKEKYKQTKAIREFYKQFDIDMEDVIDYVIENSW